jgi:hypothetical protein
MALTLARRYAAAQRLLRYQARSAVTQRKVREWGFAMALLATLQTWNKRVDPERDPDGLIFNLRALSDYAISQAANKGAHMTAALVWSAGVMARRILRSDERPSLDWLRDRAKKDGLFVDATPPADAEPFIDDRQMTLPILEDGAEPAADPEPVPVGEAS